MDEFRISAPGIGILYAMTDCVEFALENRDKFITRINHICAEKGVADISTEDIINGLESLHAVLHSSIHASIAMLQMQELTDKLNAQGYRRVDLGGGVSEFIAGVDTEGTVMNPFPETLPDTSEGE